MQTIFDLTCTMPSQYSTDEFEELDVSIEALLLSHFDERGLSLVDFQNPDSPIWIHESEQQQFTRNGDYYLSQSYLVDLNRVSSLGVMLSDIYAVFAKALIALESIELNQIHILDYYNPRMATAYQPNKSEIDQNLGFIKNLPNLNTLNSVEFNIAVANKWTPMLNLIKREFGDNATFTKGIQSLPCYCNNGLRLKKNNIQMQYSRYNISSNALMESYLEHNRLHEHLLSNQFSGLFHYLATFK